MTTGFRLFRFRMLSHRLFVWFVTLSLAPLLLLAGTGYYFSTDRMRLDAIDKLHAVAGQKAANLDDYLLSLSRQAISVSRSAPVIKAAPKARQIMSSHGIVSAEYAAFHQQFHLQLQHHVQGDDFHDLLLIDPDGNITFSIRKERDLGTNLNTGPFQGSSLAEAFREALATHHVGISALEPYAPSGRAAAFITVPVFDNGILTGIVALQVNANRINRLIRNYTGLEESGESVLAANRFGGVMFLTPLRFDADAAFKLTTQFGSGMALPMQEALQGKSGSGLSIDYRGKEVLAVWHYLPHSGWGMVQKIDVEEAYAAFDDFTALTMLIAVLAVLGGIVVAVLVSRSIAEPVVELTHAARNISSGDYSDRIASSGSDEIGQLAEAFNNMAAKLDATIKELHDKNIQIEQRSATLASANEEIKSFAYIVSHDLRSPLVNMKGFTGELEYTLKEMSDTIKSVEERLDQGEQETIKRLIDEEIPESMQFISTSVEKMDQMLSAILKLSRLGRRTLEFESIDLKQLCEEILASLSHQIKETETEVTLENLPVIENDRVVMQQILGNLIGNALKYLDPDRAGEISIRSESDETGITIHVSDNGYGISEDEKEKVFQIFRRGKHTEHQGEGMGLAYVQTLARAQGGSISFESEENVGSTFSVYLPKQNSA